MQRFWLVSVIGTLAYSVLFFLQFDDLLGHCGDSLAGQSVRRVYNCYRYPSVEAKKGYFIFKQCYAGNTERLNGETHTEAYAYFLKEIKQTQSLDENHQIYCPMVVKKNIAYTVLSWF